MSLTHPVTVVLIAIGVWWLSTGLVLAVVHRSETGRTRPVFLMVGMTVAGLVGLMMMQAGSDLVTPFGSYVGFFGALLVWAWHEAAFLTGVITGSRRNACPPGLQGTARFRAAWQAVCDHEIALFLTAVVLWLVFSGSGNLFGLATFALLWWMRISSKLLIFLGAPHAASDLMPRRISYLKTYFNTSRITPLFPLIMASAMGLFIILVFGAHRAADDHSVVGHTLLATFVALAIVEHLILVLPITDTALWRWALNRQGQEEIVAEGRHEDIARLGPVDPERWDNNGLGPDR